MKTLTLTWDLEEVPYETNDPAGGWYLHFDPTGEQDESVLYMSKANVSDTNARLIAAAPELLTLAKIVAENHAPGAKELAQRLIRRIKRGAK